MANNYFLSKAERRKLKDFVKHLKSFLGPCMDCGADHHLTWDHVRGRKVATVSRLACRGTFDQVFAEIQKCEVVCVWCHDRRECERGRNGPLDGYDYVRSEEFRGPRPAQPSGTAKPGQQPAGRRPKPPA